LAASQITFGITYPAGRSPSRVSAFVSLVVVRLTRSDLRLLSLFPELKRFPVLGMFLA
jgi:hypothetical protein